MKKRQVGGATQGATGTVKVPQPVEPLLKAIGRLATQHGAQAYAVGGCVRDWLLGIVKATTDVDVTVEGNGIEVARAGADALGGTIEVHQQFGTATVLLHRAPGRGRIRVDFASCRRETYARPAAYPRVSAGTLEEDLFRRDFTINAMALVLAPGRFGALIDPFGGARDLRMRRLHILHDRSFLDDPSRILRGIRFAQRFGFSWERATRRAMQAAVSAGALGWLNAGRLHKELDRILDEPDPRACLQQFAALLERHA
ncbi:MAG: CCA tRNA nucleotidyltransferase [Candidatus Omnitrophica bacterium]|nr:CCA tRNA nucleotidyltransferase [Candidatus Omnitrophota bacterium]